MKIIVAGTGFVGLTHAAVCSEYGHEVYAYDVDEKRIAAYRSGQREQIEQYVNEPGLASVIAENLNRYLFFCHESEVANSLLAVPTISLVTDLPNLLDPATPPASWPFSAKPTAP